MADTIGVEVQSVLKKVHWFDYITQPAGKGSPLQLQTKWEGSYKVISWMNDVTNKIQRHSREAF